MLFAAPYGTRVRDEPSMIRLRSILVCVLAVGLGWAGSTMTVVAASPESDLEQAARTFRLQVYETFRTDRVAYDDRIRQVQQILRDWRDPRHRHAKSRY